jgi:gliding-associated putative ABC transporter substrate-binding component GldG
MSEVVTSDQEHRRARTFKSGLNVIIGCVLLLVVLVGLYWLAGNAHQRLDLTRNNIYTLSDSTRDIIKKLEDRATITVYTTENDAPPDWSQRREQLRELLIQYRNVSNGKVQFTFHDVTPGSGSEAEKAAQNAGMEASLMQQASATELKLNKGYFGLQAEYRGKSETIPYLAGALEYQLTRVINKVASVSNPEIGFLAPQGNPLMGQGSQFSLLQNELEQEGFKVTALEPTALKDLSRFKLLMLIDPQNLSDEALFNIDQYVMGGGKLFVAAPGVQLNDRMGMNQVVPNPPNINSILEHYGLRISPNIVEDWKGGRSQVARTRSGTFVQFRDPFVFQTTQVNEKSSLSNKIPMMMFAYTSTVDNSDRGTSGTVTRLISSSENSRLQSGPFNLEPTELKPPTQTEQLKSQSLAMMVSGRLTSRYATEPPPVLTKDDGTTYTPTTDQVKQISTGSPEIVVVGSALLMVDQAISAVPANILLPLNVAEAFTRGSGALELRARDLAVAKLRTVTPAEASWTQVIILGGIPLLLVLFGLLKMWLNRRRRNRYRKIYGVSAGYTEQAD